MPRGKRGNAEGDPVAGDASPASPGSSTEERGEPIGSGRGLSTPSHAKGRDCFRWPPGVPTAWFSSCTSEALPAVGGSGRMSTSCSNSSMFTRPSLAEPSDESRMWIMAWKVSAAKSPWPKLCATRCKSASSMASGPGASRPCRNRPKAASMRDSTKRRNSEMSICPSSFRSKCRTTSRWISEHSGKSMPKAFKVTRNSSASMEPFALVSNSKNSLCNVSCLASSLQQDDGVAWVEAFANQSLKASSKQSAPNSICKGAATNRDWCKTR
mmetsp:Transcript_61352/g.164165  ORF Transcript_61352/g.164165 Transcript_61352/m.164165 type:complete len:269 (+) Transcript_61352:691-1497(+)